MSATMSATNRSDRVCLVLAAAAAVAALSASQARAQYRVGADGHANDVNNRIGSGGYNSPSDVGSRTNLNSQIITGNVTGLNYFHGGSQDFDANVGQFDPGNRGIQSFTAVSAPINYAQRSTGAPNFTAIYNQQNYVGPQSASLVPSQNNVSLIQQPTDNANAGLTPSNDTRLQNLNASPLDLQGTNLPTPGSLDQPGAVNNVGNQSLYATSPLYGVREIQAGDQTQDNLYISRYGNVRPGSGPRFDSNAILNARQELRADNSRTDDVAGPKSTNGTDANAKPGSTTFGQPDQTGEAVTGTAVTGQAVTGTSTAARQVPSANGTALSTQQDNLLIPANQQSPQLAALQRRFSSSTPNPTAEQTTNQNNRVRIALRKAADAKAAKARAADGTDAGPGAAGSPAGATPTYVGGGRSAVATPVAARPGSTRSELTPSHDPVADARAPISDEPFKITSLASGIRGKTLHDLLASAETQMRAGQFGQAVDTYDTAGEIAPNNPFVPLGRGFAELGASYYGKAEADLTRAITVEPAVLAGQYDLKGFLGQDRLAFVQKDLTDIANTEQTARPYLLMAYLAHNTGADDATVTTKYVDTAEARGAGKQVVELMREAWNLKPPAK